MEKWPTLCVVLFVSDQSLVGRMKLVAALAAAAGAMRMQRDQCWPTKQRRLFVSYFWTHNFKAG